MGTHLVVFSHDTMSLFDVLPPSPPTTTSRKAVTDVPLPHLAPPIVMSTPEDSPASMLGSSNQGSRKKVEFNSRPNIYSAVVFASSPEQAASIKQLPPSREHRPGGRSILKPSSQTEVPLKSMDGQQEDKISINENMDSIVQQLSKNDKPTSIDAYNTLASLFRAYDELPEAIVLKNKLSTLIRYIRRDLAVQDQASEDPTDTNLILAALKLLVILVWNSAYSPLLSDDAKTFILDRSIHVISERKASKNIIVHYLHLLSTQNFRSPMLAANNRAGRLLDVLKELSDHISGTAIVSETIMVLARLTDQARPVMKVKADCWVEILLNAMVTSSRDARQKAISFGMKACSAFATAPSVSVAFRDMLKNETDTNGTLERNVCKRLKTMLATPEDAIQVPQIWATILLLAVNTNENVNEWTSLRTYWLEVLQKCFNSGETAVRVHANFAWNRLVCLARPHQAPDDLASLLGKPLAGQMDRSGRDRQAQDSRISALSSYCNLLYYAFRPAATHKQYTRSWNEYIVKILRSSFFARNAANSEFACRIFMAFTWNSTRVTKVWKETRAHDNAVVEPEELPTIDAKWIRKNCGTVLQMFKLLFTYSSWSSTTPSGQIYIAGAWKHFAKSLRDAASKEIKASSETVQACAQVVRLVQELWKEGPRAINAKDGDVDTVTERLSFLLRVVIAELGAAPFIDVMNSKSVCLPAVLLQTFASTAVEIKSGLHGADSRLSGAYLPPKLGTPTLMLLEKTLCLLDKRLQNAYQASALDQRDLNCAIDLVSACLRDTSANVQTITLQTIQASLQVWLEDARRSSTRDQVDDNARTGAANRIAAVVIPCLASLPLPLVEILDGLFAAGFSSTHKSTINQMVEMWNPTHGQASQIEYGPSLTTALTRLRPYVEIELANFPLSDHSHSPESNTDDAPPPFLDFVESQSQLAAIETTEELGGDLELGPQEKENFVSPHAEEVAEFVPPSRPQSSHSTPRRSRRHNDSQVQFQQIDSSPLNVIQAESQYLTERQKEIRDRQRQDASVYFSDLKPDMPAKHLHEMSCFSELNRQASLQAERPSTPTLPDRGLTDFDNNPIASPTPRSKHQALRLEDIDAPSSPLSVQANEDAISQENVDGEGLSEKGLEDDHEMPVDEQDVFDASPMEPQQANSVHKGILEETGEEARSTDFAGLLDETAQTTNVPLEDLPGMTPPERELHENTASASHEQITSSDSAAADVHSQPGDGTRTDSDDFDMMSQSQLSQDLELHASDYGDLCEPLPTLEQEEPDQKIKSSSEPAATQKKRKRGRTSYAGSKRRKSRSLSRSLSIASQDEQEVVYDCIEVDTSSRPPLAEVRDLQSKSQVQTHTEKIAPEGKVCCVTAAASIETGIDELGTDAHRMLPPPALTTSGLSVDQKRLSEYQQHCDEENTRYLRNSLTSADPPANSISEVSAAEVVETITERKDGASVSTALPLAAIQESGALITNNPTSDIVSDTGKVTSRLEEVAAQPDIMASLQMVLERLKRSSGKDLDLRTIDDLCFQIRTEGQNATTRWSSH
jgi:hypothetical protein